MRKITFILPILIIIFFFLMPQSLPALAVTPCSANEMPTDLGCLPTDPIGFTQKFYGWGLALLGFVAVMFFMIGGYFLIASRGNMEYVSRGKSYIYYAIAGLLLAILGFVFIEIVAGDILRIPGFGR